MQNFLNIFSWFLKMISEHFQTFFNSFRVNGTNPEREEILFNKPPQVSKHSKIIEVVKKIYADHGGIFEDVNILGVRNERDPDEWNDFFIIVIGDRVFKFEGTTDPGRYYTDHPLDPNGAFHINLGFHKHIFKRGFHRGYPALVQTGKPVHGWRDKNKNFLNDDNIHEVKTESINFHHGYSTLKDIGKNSAGCQVVRKIEDLKLILAAIDETGQKEISYLLILLEHCPDVLKNLAFGKMA